MENKNGPVDVLRSFINEMRGLHIIGQKFKKINEYFANRDILLADQRKIFSKYLTIKTGRYLQDIDMPIIQEYNIETNKILSCIIENRTAYIEVQETEGFKDKLKYTLQLETDGWKIDKKESFDKYEKKWKEIIL